MNSVRLYYIKHAGESDLSQIGPMLVEQWKSSLSVLKKDAIQRLLHHRNQVDSLAGLRLLRMCARDEGIANFDLKEVVYPAEGKPYWRKKDSFFDFNISHSGNFILVATSQSVILGVDVEKIKELKRLNFKMVMSPEELAKIREQPVLFFDLWSKKEAVVKAADTVGLAKMGDVSLNEDGANLDDRSWYLKTLNLDEAYVINLATNPYGKKPQQTSSEEAPDGVVVKDKKQPRRMTVKRKIGHVLLKPMILLIVNFIWLTCRVKVTGQENMDAIIEKQKPVIPCYWHQQHLFCAWYMLRQIKRGMKVGFLVSPSVDGEIPAQIVSSRGAKVIRGSSTRTGAQALRDMYQIIAKEGVSPVTTSDGPTGPIFKFKPGAAMLSQMTKAPMVPVACAAKRSDKWINGTGKTNSLKINSNILSRDHRSLDTANRVIIKHPIKCIIDGFNFSAAIIGAQ